MEEVMTLRRMKQDPKAKTPVDVVEVAAEDAVKEAFAAIIKEFNVGIEVLQTIVRTVFEKIDKKEEVLTIDDFALYPSAEGSRSSPIAPRQNANSGSRG
jgi:hypothetical protein